MENTMYTESRRTIIISPPSKKIELKIDLSYKDKSEFIKNI